MFFVVNSTIPSTEKKKLNNYHSINRLFFFKLLEVFLGFLKAYVEKFSYKSITTDDWKDFLYSHFKDKVGF